MRRHLPRVVVLALVAAALAALPDLSRPGYSPDEEFTLYAARSIAARGLPLLPSGLLYDRGLGYSYAAWLAGAVAGQALPVYRAVSLAFGLAALARLFVSVRRIASIRAAVLATAMAGASLPFWATVTAARFYGPFLFFYVAALAACAGRGTAASLAVMAAAFGARASHELAFMLAAVPVVGLLLVPREDRGRWFRHAAAMLVGLAAAQAVLTGVHYLAPSSGGTMVRRFFLWQVLNILEMPPLTLVQRLPAAAGLAGVAALAAGLVLAVRREWLLAAVVVPGALGIAVGQLGVAPLLALCLLTIVPGSARRLIGAAAVVMSSGAAYWLVALLSSGRPLSDAGALLATTACVYPLDLLRYLLAETPLLTHAALLVLVVRAFGIGEAWSPVARGLHALWLGWVLWFGVMESGINARYLLVPFTVMVAAVAVDAVALTEAIAHRRPRPVLNGLLPAMLAVAVVVESWVGVPPGAGRFTAARPTIHASGLSAEVLPGDVVASNDELACLLLAGRIDAWLTLDDFFRERFIVQRDGRAVGVYTAAPAADTIAPVLDRAAQQGGRLLIVDVAKDVPGFGSSAPLVARALAREGLEAEVVASYSGVRLLAVSRAPVMVSAGPRTR